MLLWLHKLFNPHCSHCHDEAREKKICETCETLKQLLEVEKAENRMLLERILREPEVIESKPHEMPQPLMPKNIASVRVRREMLEEQSRKEAQLLRDKQKELEIIPKSVEELEKELGVTHAS